MAIQPYTSHAAVHTQTQTQTESEAFKTYFCAFTGKLDYSDPRYTLFERPFRYERVHSQNVHK